MTNLGLDLMKDFGGLFSFSWYQEMLFNTLMRIKQSQTRLLET